MKASTFGLKPKTIMELLRIGSKQRGKNKPGPSADRKAALLKQWLDQRLPAEAVPTRVSRDVSEQDPEELVGEPGSQWPLERLLSGKTNLDMIIALKDYAKDKVASTQDELEREVATAVYYASIANAYVFYGQMITRHSKMHLQKASAMLAQKHWIADTLRDLFNKVKHTSG